MNTARPDARLFPPLALVVWPTSTLAVAAPSPRPLPRPLPRPSSFPALASVRWECAARVGA